MAKIEFEQSEEPEVQMAPMIDCMFLLLIFFLIVANVKKKHEELPIEFYAPDKYEEKKDPDNTLVISILKPQRDSSTDQKRRDEQKRAECDYAFSTVGQQMRTSSSYQELRTLNQLRQEIAKAAASNPNRRVRLDIDCHDPTDPQDPFVPFQAVAKVLEFLEVYGLNEIGLRTLETKKK